MVAANRLPCPKDTVYLVDDNPYPAHSENVNKEYKERSLVLRTIFVTTLTLVSVLGVIMLITQSRDQGELFLKREAIEMVDQFIDFIQRHKKDYSNDEDMAQSRFETYFNNLNEIERLNEESVYGAKYGENYMSDWTDDEFIKILMPKENKRSSSKTTFLKHAPKSKRGVEARPDFFDWREKNVISPVKAQGKCGSCWAFAATATVEAAFAIAHGEMRNLSEQTLLDCDFDDDACNGGDEDKAFRYIHRRGLAYSVDLPYVEHRQNSCDIHGNVTTIKAAYQIHPDETSMLDWLLDFGPVNIGIAVTKPMKLYKEGVFQPSYEDCHNDTMILGLHSLLVTGYGTSNEGVKYWIVKNSWGQSWGTENGYVYFARGVNACGIEDEPMGVLA